MFLHFLHHLNHPYFSFSLLQFFCIRILKLPIMLDSLFKSGKLGFLSKFKSLKKKRESNNFSSFAGLEISHQLKQVFRFIDTDGDGKISPLELSGVLLSLGHTRALATKEAECIVREMDSDGDGFVDLDEFMNVVAKSDENQQVVLKEDELFQAFMIFDSDKNGLISAMELQRVLAGLGCKKCRLRDCRRMIKGVDRDGDGCVSFQEFKSMMSTSGCN